MRGGQATSHVAVAAVAATEAAARTTAEHRHTGEAEVTETHIVGAWQCVARGRWVPASVPNTVAERLPEAAAAREAATACRQRERADRKATVQARGTEAEIDDGGGAYMGDDASDDENARGDGSEGATNDGTESGGSGPARGRGRAQRER